MINNWRLLAGLVALVIIYKLVPKKNIWFGVLMFGGIANSLERLITGKVYDYWHFGLLAFNLADIAIVTGMLGLVYTEIYAGRNNLRGRKHPSSE